MTNDDDFQSVVAAAQAQQEYRRLRAQGRYDQMKGGPYIEVDELVGNPVVVIPSAWFNEDARRFWRKVDATFIRREKVWVRPVGLPYNGKKHTVHQWLESIRKKFFEFHEDELAQAKKVFSTSTYHPL